MWLGVIYPLPLHLFMRGVSRIVTTSALVLMGLALLAAIYPTLHSAVTGLADAIGVGTRNLSTYAKSDVVIVPPPAHNPLNVNQTLIIHNMGSTVLTQARVIMIDVNGNSTDLNFVILGENGSFISKNDINPGEAIIATVPSKPSYIGYTFLFISREYTESEKVG